MLSSETTVRQLTLGQELAFIRFEKKHKLNIINDLPTIDKERFSHLKNRAEELHISGDFLKVIKILRENYKEEPKSNLNNEDFYISLFLFDSSDKDCIRLATAFNDRFELFSEFSEVLRDFVNQYNFLKKEYNK
jgi:hypothetical protein